MNIAYNILIGIFKNILLPTLSIFSDKIKSFFADHGFECHTRINEDPDEDLLIMSNSKYFIPSGGGFSRIITNIVKLKGGVVIPSSSQSLLSIQSESINQKRNPLSFLPESNLSTDSSI